MTLPAAPERAPAPPDPRRTSRANGWFRAVWRWHFFASFLVVPVLLLLATTGLIYLFRFQLEPLLHPDLMKVERRAALAQPYVAQLAVVEQEYPGSTAVSLAEPRDDHSPTIVSVTTADGAGRDVFVDPYRLEVLGLARPGHDALRPGDPAARRADGRAVGRPRHRGGRLLGVRDGADRLLPVRPRLAGPARARRSGAPGRHAAPPARRWSAPWSASGCSPCW